ncbi:DUF6270 domain-containing protein [Phenylobacterium sp.]|jgi:hypothetical protein|uniref:DUF6270 domain-containing protein n=1 Tax=Phenylobacterium sp. TaxID=1871053 RepID=UPI002F3EAF0B
MPRVAVVGSCITRDLWPVPGERVEGLLYISRTSLPSLFAPPVAGFEPAPAPPNGLGRHQHEAVVSDLAKRALAALVAHRPTHIIFDFIDERFDLLSVAGTFATHSWELEVSGYLDQPALQSARAIPRLSDACERLWLRAAGELSAFLRATPLRDAVLVLHEARWAETWVDAEGARRPFEDVEIWSGRPADIAAHNAMLARYQEAFRAATPGVVRVRAQSHVADAGHRWGLSPFHYVDGYYREIWDQLRALGA